MCNTIGSSLSKSWLSFHLLSKFDLCRSSQFNIYIEKLPELMALILFFSYIVAKSLFPKPFFFWGTHSLKVTKLCDPSQ